MRLELTRSCDHYPLKVACIPISPPALGCPEQDSNLHTSRHAHLKRTRLPIPPSGQKKRAENETRTRDPDLGKVVLYQLSYFRNFSLLISKRSLLHFQKRVQRYCFFLNCANFFAKKCISGCIFFNFPVSSRPKHPKMGQKRVIMLS